MKKSDLKNIIKPLVKECIHEVLLEEGLLSNVVSEVAKGLNSNVVVEQKQQVVRPQPKVDPAQELAERRKKLMAAVNKDAYNGIDIFEGTTPIKEAASTPGTPDLGAPDDAGVDISSIIGTSSKIWERLKQD